MADNLPAQTKNKAGDAGVFSTVISGHEKTYAHPMFSFGF